MTYSLQDSYYLFQQNQELSVILFTVVILLLLFAISNIILIALRVNNNYTIKFRKFIRVDASVFAIIIAILLGYPSIKNYLLINRIKQKPGFTVGSTTQWINLGRMSFNVEYHYSVNGKQYASQANPVYDGEEIPGIKVPDGHYRVIYNLVAPEESVIDFKIIEDEKANSELP